MTSSILAIGTAVPEYQIPQNKVVAFMAKAHGMNEKETARLKALYRATGIKSRFSTIPDYALLGGEPRAFFPESKNLEPFPTTKIRAEYYRKHAKNLSLKSSKACLRKADIEVSKITHLITISCTGMYAPGLDIDLVNGLGLNGSVERTCINFMGCYAAIVGLRTAYAYCQANPKANVLVVATELCTLHFQNKTDEDNLISNAIFGDGSAAVLVGNSSAQSGLKLSPLSFHNELIPDGANDMAWNIGNFGFEMKLSTYVPQLIEKGIKSLVEKAKEKSSVKSVDHYAIHPGGKRILEVVEQELGIARSDNKSGWNVLQQYGNMSSPTVIFVLNDLFQALNESNRGDKVLSMAFGPGLTVESMILEVC